MKKVDIGIIGAMAPEVEILLKNLTEAKEEQVGSISFHIGTLRGKRVAIARCGIGKVFAAICAEAMIIAYSPSLIINTGVGGALAGGINILDVVVAEKLVQHDMDTSALGDQVGLVSGINRVFFEADERGLSVAKDAAGELGVNLKTGIIASGDLFVAAKEKKAEIVAKFGASVCEMEGAAIAHTAFVNSTPFIVIRAVSDTADDSSSMDYMQFLPRAAEISSKLTMEIVEKY